MQNNISDNVQKYFFSFKLPHLMLLFGWEKIVPIFLFIRYDSLDV